MSVIQNESKNTEDRPKSLLTESVKKRKTTEKTETKDSSSVYLGAQFTRWKEMKGDLALKSDAHF